MFVKPSAPDLKIRDPKTRALLPADGRNVPDTSFWRRRLRDNSIELATPPAPATAAEAAPQAEPAQSEHPATA